MDSFFKLNSDPPDIKLKEFYVQLLIAHVIFGIVAALVKNGCNHCFPFFLYLIIKYSIREFKARAVPFVAIIGRSF